jgi:hypothetical protein
MVANEAASLFAPSSWWLGGNTDAPRRLACRRDRGRIRVALITMCSEASVGRIEPVFGSTTRAFFHSFHPVLNPSPSVRAQFLRGPLLGGQEGFKNNASSRIDF